MRPDVQAVFPVAMKDARFAWLPPEVPARYVFAANGVFLEQRTPCFAAGVRVDRVAGLRVAGLESHDEWLELSLPSIEHDLLARTVAFFRFAYERWGGEAMVLLFLERPAPGRKPRWAIDAPPQLISGQWRPDGFRAGLRLVYGTCDKPGRDWIRAGSIHSHAASPAYHSETDVQDEIGGAGLHITIGRLDRSEPEFAASFVVGETRFAVSPASVLPPLQGEQPPPAAWLDRIGPAFAAPLPAATGPGVGAAPAHSTGGAPCAS